MTTLEKIRAEINEYGSLCVEYQIKGHTDRDIEKIIENVLRQAKKQVLSKIDKYAEQEPSDEWQRGYDMAWEEAKVFYEQEPCENCDYSEIMDWEQDAKTGKAKPIYWCEKHKEPSEDAVSRAELIKVVTGEDFKADFPRMSKSLETIICALPSVQPKPIECEDAVSRQAIKKLKRHNLVEGQFVSLYDIEQLPIVQPKQKGGEQ